MVIEPIEGHWVRLRCAEEKDAEFTLAIRADTKLNKYIPEIKNTIEEQKAWINKQRKSDDSCFLVFENLQGELLGTKGFYEIDWDAKTCETGRYISYGNPMENLETTILLYDFLFEVKKFNKIFAHIINGNKSVIHINKEWFGYEPIQEVLMPNGHMAHQYFLVPEKYYTNRPRIMAILEKAKQKGL